MVDFIIFFVTSKCNSHCKFCFYKNKLNRNDDVSLEEIRKISLQLGFFSNLLFSGGEPFLRKDLPEIINIFVSQNKVKNIHIPTNGITTSSIVSTVQKILNDKRNSDVTFSVNPSVDALEPLDISLRGREDAFSSVIETIKELGKLKKYHKNLQVAVNSVFSNENYSDLKDLVKLIDGFDFIDFHNLEVMRPRALCDYSTVKVDLDGLKKLHLLILKLHEHRLKIRIIKTQNIFQYLRALARVVGWVGHIRYSQTIKEKFLNKKIGLFACPAGKEVCVIDSNGDIKICELRETLGNLRDNDYNINAVLRNQKTQSLRKEIIKSKCSCTHICFIDEYIHLGVKHINPKIILMIIYHYFKFFCLNLKKDISLDVKS